MKKLDNLKAERKELEDEIKKSVDKFFEKVGVCKMDIRVSKECIGFEFSEHKFLETEVEVNISI